MTNVVGTASADDGTKLATHTKGQGMYQIPGVRAGRYVLRFETPGFVPAERTLSVLVGQVATVDVAWQLASASTTVVVEGPAAGVGATTPPVRGELSPPRDHAAPLHCPNYRQPDH